MVDTAADRRRIRPLPLALAILALLGLVLWRGAPRILRLGLLLAAEAAHLEPRSLEVRRLAWGRLEIADVVLGKAGDLAAASITVRYAPRDLLRLRLARVTLRGLRVHGRLEGGGLAPGALATLLSSGGGPSIHVDELIVEQGRLALDSPAGEAAARFDGRASFSDAGGFEGDARFTVGEGEGAVAGSLQAVREREGGAFRARLSADANRLTARLDFEPAGAAPPAAEGAVEAKRGLPAGRGTLDLSARGASLPGLVSDLRMDGGFRFDAAPRALRLWSPGGLRAKAGTLDAELRAKLPPAVRAALDGALELTLEGAAEGAPLLLAREESTGWRLAWNAKGAGRAATGAALEVDARGDAAFGADGGGRMRVTLSPLALRARGWTLPAGRIEAAALRLEGAGTGASFEADLRATARLRVSAGGTTGDLPLDASLRARLAREDGAITLAPEDCLELKLGNTRLGKTATLMPIALCVAASGGAPLLTLRDRPAGKRDLALRAALRPAAFQVATAGAAAALGALEGELPAIAITVDGDPAGPLRFRVTGAGGGLAARGLDLKASGVHVDLSGRLKERPEAEGSLAVAAIAGAGRRPLLAPLAFSGRAALREGALTFSGSLRNRGGALRLEAEGSHDLPSGRGSARVTLAPFRLGPSPKLRELSPALAARVERAGGTVDASGTFRWKPGRLETPLRVRLTGVSFETPEIGVKDLGGDLRFRGILPPRAAAGQVLRVGRIQAGVVLTDGRAVFGITDEGRVEIQEAEGRVLGGTLSGSGWVERRGEGGEGRLDLVGLRLSDLAAALNLDGITAAGEMSGTVPIEVRGHRVTLRGARLAAAGEGGWIRYRPTARPAAFPEGDTRFDPVLAILDDFRYHSLVFKLDGPLLGELAIVTEIKGFNPAYQDGQRVDFTLNVGGRLYDLLRKEMVVTTISESFGRRLREGQTEGGE